VSRAVSYLRARNKSSRSGACPAKKFWSRPNDLAFSFSYTAHTSRNMQKNEDNGGYQRGASSQRLSENFCDLD
jgi:hypothetical protein